MPQWELALELFQEMLREQCTPNTVTYNSLITALAQGEQWWRWSGAGGGSNCQHSTVHPAGLPSLTCTYRQRAACARIPPPPFPPPHPVLLPLPLLLPPPTHLHLPTARRRPVAEGRRGV